MDTDKTRCQHAATQAQGTSQREKNISLLAQGNYLKVILPVNPLRGQGGGKRSGITGFSAQSRKRMLDTIAKIDADRAGFIAFVTLTYPDRDGPPTFELTSRDKATFLKRLARRFPETSAIWRREWEERKSGEFMGELYPHFHLLFFNLPFFHRDEVNTIWKEVIGYPDYTRTEIKAVESLRMALWYVAKYMAKHERLAEDDTEALEALPAGAIRRSPTGSAADGFGGEGAPLSPLVNPERGNCGTEIHSDQVTNTEERKQGGRSSLADVAAGPEAAHGGVEDAAPCSLVYVTYPTEHDKQTDSDNAEAAPAQTEDSPKAEGSTNPTGRHWGVFQRKKLPFAESKVERIPVGTWIKEFREMAGQVWPPAAEPTGLGFSLYVDNAYEWIETAERLNAGELE